MRAAGTRERSKAASDRGRGKDAAAPAHMRRFPRRCGARNQTAPSKIARRLHHEEKKTADLPSTDQAGGRGGETCRNRKEASHIRTRRERARTEDRHSLVCRIVASVTVLSVCSSLSACRYSGAGRVQEVVTRIIIMHSCYGDLGAKW